MKSSSRTVLYLILIALCVIGAIAGSFYDLPIAQTLYKGDGMITRIISLTTVIVFFESCIFFLGVLFAQFLAKDRRILRRVIASFIFIYLFISTASLGGAKVLNDPLLTFLEGRLSGFKGTLGGSLAAGTVLCLGVFIAGILINGQKYDPAVIKTLIKLICVFSIGFFLAHYLNCMIDRPGYSMLLANGSTEGFKRWYELPKDGKLLMSLNDLLASHQGSFVSGHTLYAVMFIVIFPAYSIVFPAIRRHEKTLMVSAGVWAVIVIACRLISGGNYLTDISFAAFYSLKFCMTYNGIKLKRKRCK